MVFEESLCQRRGAYPLGIMEEVTAGEVGTVRVVNLRPPQGPTADMWSSWGGWAYLWRRATTMEEFLPKLRGIMLWEWGKLGH